MPKQPSVSFQVRVPWDVYQLLMADKERREKKGEKKSMNAIIVEMLEERYHDK